MKRVFSTDISVNAVSFWLLVFRVAMGLLMLTHGIPKLQMLMAGDIKFSDPLGIGTTPSLILVVFAEVACSVLLIFGLATRFASLALVINMVVAVFYALSKQPFTKKELAVIYLLIYCGFLILGAGKYSVDHLITGGKSKRR